MAAVARPPDLTFERLVTDRLVLEPIAPEVAAAVVRGDLSGLRVGEGWPHADTVDGLGMAVRSGHAPGWFVTLGRRDHRRLRHARAAGRGR